MFLIAPTTMSSSAFFFFNDTATTEIYTLSLHDALPICHRPRKSTQGDDRAGGAQRPVEQFPERPPGRYRRQAYGRTLPLERDRKSTRLNSSHQIISYAVFCLKKKKKQQLEHLDYYAWI